MHSRCLMIVVALVVAVSGCGALPTTEVEHFPRYQPEPAPQIEPLELPLAQRLAMPVPDPSEELAPPEPLYSFVIANMGLQDALRQFARAYELNLVIAADVHGLVDVAFNDVSLAQAMSLMLDPLNYYWTAEDGVIHVRSIETRRFSVDYLRLVRSGSGTTTAKVSTGSGAGQTGGDGGGEEDEAGRIVIAHQDEVQFWAELEAQVSSLLGAEGKLVVNRLSGTILVTDQHAHVEEVALFLDALERAIHRQVDIQVSILEVALEDTQSFGINWERVANALDISNALSFNIDGQVISPAGGFEAKDSLLDLLYSEEEGGDEVSALVSALSEQGDVEIVSQPHVRTLNNQTSLIKVGTDRTFFRREQSIDSTSAGSITTATDIPQVVTEGVVLSITPQISANGWIMMDVSPVVTRVSSVSNVLSDSGQVLSSAPNLDVAQVTSLVRARSGETVVIGGLIQTQRSLTERNLPGTRWVGALKNLAGGSYHTEIKTELVMVITPTLVTDGAVQ